MDTRTAHVLQDNLEERINALEKRVKSLEQRDPRIIQVPVYGPPPSDCGT